MNRPPINADKHVHTKANMTTFLMVKKEGVSRDSTLNERGPLPLLSLPTRVMYTFSPVVGGVSGRCVNKEQRS